MLNVISFSIYIYFFILENIFIRNKLQACDNGRGAVLLAIARGKVSEGVDFCELSY